jgi:ornithine carbamoyltransferase
MTAQEHFGELEGRTLAFIGDGNNVARSLAVACGKFNMAFVLASPAEFKLEQPFVDSMDPYAYRWTDRAADAVAGADIVYTDTWVSMGQEQEKQHRLKAFAGFQINAELMSAAPKHAVVMHCLPAYRGYEITDDVFEAQAEIIMEEAENRLHFQRSLLNVLLGEGGIG